MIPAEPNENGARQEEDGEEDVEVDLSQVESDPTDVLYEPDHLNEKQEVTGPPTRSTMNDELQEE
jgi:hypothetical protein